MTASKAQQRATQKYVANKYDRFVLTIKKDSECNKKAIQDAAATAGLSVNSYIVTAITEKMERDQQKAEWSASRKRNNMAQRSDPQ